MNFETLLKDEIFELPLVQTTKENFKTFIIKKLKLFLKKINELEDGSIHPNKNISTDFVKRIQEKIVENLISCIEEYYNRNPFKSYEKLNNVFRNEKDLYAIVKEQ